MQRIQEYRPLRNMSLSALVAVIPLCIRFCKLAAQRTKEHFTALAATGASPLAEILRDMPVISAFGAALHGKTTSPQSIFVAMANSRLADHKGGIFRFTFFHSLAPALVLGVLTRLKTMRYDGCCLNLGYQTNEPTGIRFDLVR